MIAFLAPPAGGSALDLLGSDPRVTALGLLDPTLGDYNQQQALLDLTQGAWVNRVVYHPKIPPPLGLTVGGRIVGWSSVLARASAASARLEPGALAGTIAGGAAFVSAAAAAVPVGPSRRAARAAPPRSGAAEPEAVVAADRAGRLGAISIGAPGSVAARAGALLRRFALVVVGPTGLGQLDRLLERRAPGELVLVLERPPATRPAEQLSPQLLAVGAAGLAGGGGELRSPTTRLPGFVTALDVAPTVLRWIGARVPPAVHGQAITSGGGRDPARLARFRARLAVIGDRRWPTIIAFLLGWVALSLGGAAAAGRRGGRAALRLGGLAALWTPCTVLAAGALAPSEPVEITVIVGGALTLAVISDRLAAWPRGPMLPAAAMVVAYVVDLSLGSPLVSVSLLGSNPIAGGRFFGVGNELEAALPVVLFAGLAAALPRRPPSTRDARIFGGIGLAFTALIAWGRLGADVGAVFTIGGGAAIGALMLIPALGRRTIALACGLPFLGLVVLAGLDLATGAGGHYTGTVLDAGSPGAVADTVARKLAAALRQLRRGVMPIDTVVCVAAGVYAIHRRDHILAPVGVAAGWRAALVGSLAAGVLGSLSNDSGPVLLVIATFGLGCVLTYVRGGPGAVDRADRRHRMPSGVSAVLTRLFS